MRNSLFIILLTTIATTACLKEKPRNNLEAAPLETDAGSPVLAKEVEFETKDGVTVFGNLYTQNATALTLLLFHQAGANGRGEYGPIIPRLLDKGYNVLVVDQRAGGNRFGESNRTAEQHGQEASYCEAYPDLEAALHFILGRGFSGPRAIWGSSYSAALVIKLAIEHAQDIQAVLAFSPASGEPMGDCQPNQYLASLKPTLLVMRPGKEAEIPSVQTQLALAKEHGHQTYVAPQGVHGSSMLVEARTKSDVTATWKVVEDFLAGIER